GNFAEGAAHQPPAVATGRSEDVAKQAARVHAHQHALLSGDIAAHQGQVVFGVEVAGVGDAAEVAELGLDATFGLAAHETLVFHSVADNFSHRDHFEAVAETKLVQLRHAGHGAILVHDFA